MQKLFLVLAILFTSTQAHANDAFENIQIGNWTGRNFADEKTGKFSSCAASTPYRSGINFFVFVGRDYKWSLAFSNLDWNFELGSKIPASFLFDGRKRFTGLAWAFSKDTIVFDMAADSELINAFRYSTFLDAFMENQKLSFRLDGTSRLLPALASCVTRQLEIERVANTPNENVSAAIGQKSSNNSSVSEQHDTEIEAIKLATNLAISLQLIDAKIVRKKDLPVNMSYFDAGFQFGKEYGGLKLLPALKSDDGLTVASDLISLDGRNCKGKFASGRTSELIDNKILHIGFSSCEDSDGRRSVQHFIVPRGQEQGLVIYSLPIGAKLEGSNQPLSQDNMDGIKRAAINTF